jgi:hypothetical protein
MIKPDITARVDTANIEIKKVYHLYKNYLNSRPDSIYKNPNWNSKENENILKDKYSRVDRAAVQMFNYYSAKQYFSFYKPKILQIDKVNDDRYQIKTIFMAYCEDDDYKTMTPTAITKLYAVKDAEGEYKLENAIGYDTRNWKTYKYKYIQYVVHPSCVFNMSEAKKANEFCTQFVKRFDLKEIQPFTYYITPNSDEMGKVYNFEYWLSYMTGQTRIMSREIFTAYGNENFPHEFVHILFPHANEPSLMCPMIIMEGLATWQAGAGQNETFEEGLKVFSKQIQNNDTLTIDEIITFKYRNPFDNSALYLTGGVICKLVYDEHGVKGILAILKKASHILQTNELNPIIDKAYTFEKSLFDVKTNSWLDNRLDEKTRDIGAWCHGSGGIALSKLIYLNFEKSKIFEEELQFACENIKLLSSTNQGLCHGSMSNIEILTACDKYFNQTKYQNITNNFLDQISTQIIEGKSPGVSETGNLNLTGMFIGKTGVAYQLLRFHDWINMPSTLCLETPLFFYKTLH